jgi:hypothetical protein
MLPRRPSHPPSEEVVREALRGIPFHAKKKLHLCPQNVLRRPAGQINGPPRSHAARPRRRNHQGNAPCNDHGAPSVDRPWGVVHAAMSPLMPLTPVSRVNLNLPCIYQVLAHPGSSYAVSHAQYPNLAQSPGRMLAITVFTCGTQFQGTTGQVRISMVAIKCSMQP